MSSSSSSFFGSTDRVFEKPSLLFQMQDLSTEVQTHLIRVYRALLTGVLAIAAGVALQMYTGIGGTFFSLASIGVLFYMQMGHEKSETPSRQLWYHGFCLLQGMGLGPLIAAVASIDPGIIVTAVLATVCVFAAFSGAALFARRREYLFLGGILGSMTLVLLVLGLFGRLFGLVWAFELNLYLGLLVFCGYVVFDTQIIIEKASAHAYTGGSSDVLGDATSLLIDFVGIFVRLLIILAKNSKKERK